MYYISSNIQKYSGFLKKEAKRFIEFSKSKTKNQKVTFLYEYIIFINEIKSHNGDFWSMGGGSNDIQGLLNEFESKDWEDLTMDTLNWDVDDTLLLIESVGFGFDGAFTPSLNENKLGDAGDFYLNLFTNTSDIEIQTEIIYYSFLINKSGSNQLSKLLIMKNWLIQYKYDSDIWINSTLNPLGNIEDSIEKLSHNI